MIGSITLKSVVKKEILLEFVTENKKSSIKNKPIQELVLGRPGYYRISYLDAKNNYIEKSIRVYQDFVKVDISLPENINQEEEFELAIKFNNIVDNLVIYKNGEILNNISKPELNITFKDSIKNETLYLFEPKTEDSSLYLEKKEVKVIPKKTYATSPFQEIMINPAKSEIKYKNNNTIKELAKRKISATLNKNYNNIYKKIEEKPIILNIYLDDKISNLNQEKIKDILGRGITLLRPEEVKYLLILKESENSLRIKCQALSYLYKTYSLKEIEDCMKNTLDLENDIKTSTFAAGASENLAIFLTNDTLPDFIFNYEFFNLILPQNNNYSLGSSLYLSKVLEKEDREETLSKLKENFKNLTGNEINKNEDINGYREYLQREYYKGYLKTEFLIAYKGLENYIKFRSSLKNTKDEENMIKKYYFTSKSNLEMVINEYIKDQYEGKELASEQYYNLIKLKNNYPNVRR